jgi:O-antigen/teichoic acid export membrane protein
MHDPFDGDDQSGAKPAGSLRHGIAFAAAGNAAFNLCRVGIVVLIAKFASAETLGVFDYSLAVSAPVVTFLMLQLRAAYVADVQRAFPLGAYYTLRRIGMLTAGLLLAGFAIYWLIQGQSTAAVVIFAAVCYGKLIWSTAEIFWGEFQRRERLDRFAVAMTIRGIVMVLPFAVMLPLWQAQPMWAVAAAALTYAVAWTALFWMFERRTVWRALPTQHDWSWAQVAALARQTAPLGLVVLLIAACDSLPRIMIKIHAGPEELGYFSAIYNAVVPLMLLVIAVGHAAANRSAQLYRADVDQLRRLALRLALAGFALGGLAWVAAVFLGRAALRILFAPEYAAYADDLVIVMAGGVLLLPAALFGTIVTSAQRFWVQVPLQGVILLVMFVVAEMTIPTDPVSGGAWSFVARSATQFVVYGGLLLWILRRRPARDND